jgi:hypothetical protein
MCIQNLTCTICIIDTTLTETKVSSNSNYVVRETLFSTSKDVYTPKQCLLDVL